MFRQVFLCVWKRCSRPGARETGGRRASLLVRPSGPANGLTAGTLQILRGRLARLVGGRMLNDPLARQGAHYGRQLPALKQIFKSHRANRTTRLLSVKAHRSACCELCPWRQSDHAPMTGGQLLSENCRLLAKPERSPISQAQLVRRISMLNESGRFPPRNGHLASAQHPLKLIHKVKRRLSETPGLENSSGRSRGPALGRSAE